MKDFVEKLEEILTVGTIENVTDRYKNRKPNPYSPVDMELCLMAEKGNTLYEFSPSLHPSEYDCQISNSSLYDFVCQTWIYLQEIKRT